MAERDEAFQAALDALAPTPGEDGRIDIDKEVVAFEQALGRQLTPDEHGPVRDRIWEAVILASLNAEYEETPPEPEKPGTA